MQKIGEGKREQMKHRLCWCMRSSGGWMSWQTAEWQSIQVPWNQSSGRNTVWKLGYSMRPSRSVSGTFCPVVVSYTDRLFTLWLCTCILTILPPPILTVKSSIDSEDGIWSVEGIPTIYRLHFFRMFTFCCDRKVWHSCKQSGVRNKKCNFSCSFCSSFIYPSIHHLPWIESNFPVQTAKRKMSSEGRVILKSQQSNGRLVRQ